jgi:hypothetical protein
MGVMQKLKIFAVKEPVVTASCLIAGFGTRTPSFASVLAQTLADALAPIRNGMGAHAPVMLLHPTSVLRSFAWLDG